MTLVLQWSMAPPTLTLQWGGPTAAIAPAVQAQGLAAVATVIGPPGPSLPPGSYGFNHIQAVPAASWVIVHNLGFRPNVAVTDSAGSRVEGGIRHDSDNQVTLTFSGAFSGRARLS